jgi:transcription-repair coupling factor (superfamily II helicase)
MKAMWTHTELFQTISRVFQDNSDQLVITGLIGSQGASLVAGLVKRFERASAVVVRDAEEARKWFRDIKFFLSEQGDEILSNESSFNEPAVRTEAAGRVILFPGYSGQSENGRDSQAIFHAHAQAALHSVQYQKHPVAVIPASFLGVHTGRRRQFSELSLRLYKGVEIAIKTVIESLGGMGYERVLRVESPGEFTQRGGILDIFVPVYTFPVRIEYFGNEILSIREFDPLTQRSISRVNTVHVTRAVKQNRETESVSFFNCLAEWFESDPAIFWIEPDVIIETLRKQDPGGFKDMNRRMLPGSPSVIGDIVTHGRMGSGTYFELPVLPVPEFNGDYRKMVDAFRAWTDDNYQIAVVYYRESLRKLVSERLAIEDTEWGMDGPNWTEKRHRDAENGARPTVFLPGELSKGFRLPQARVVFVTERDIVGLKRKQPWRRKDESDAALSFRDLNPGDLVVHVDHGIGRYDGLHRLIVDGKERDFLLLRYAEQQKLYIPVDKLFLVQRYLSSSDSPPPLDRMGGVAWKTKKKKVRESVLRLAAELLDLFSRREVIKGFSFPADDIWQHEFEMDFEYEETPDQLQAIHQIKTDMEKARPMDRIVCGDVGFGKTEVAMRAAFKAAAGGKQVALMAPTTILTQQHFRSFRKRFEKFPIRIAMVSRFLSACDKKNVLKEISRGTVDIVIGTHAILGEGVHFKDLGLVIIDEEHRFGVRHKEKLKKLRTSVDVLMLTATPIPRTMNMALLGLREISLINTPPDARRPIKTRIVKFDLRLIRQAILDEINRGGQVYFVHNRVQSIAAVADMLAKLVPEAKIEISHGQMKESALEKVMLRFLEKEFNVLVCTTIIESGLDIPSVNTIIINRADKLGLAQLYQLRGRVGRDRYQAFAWLMIPASRTVTPKAMQRLAAIQQALELGAGFSLATRDLDIRGAGDILGPNQHGHISAVGFDMYCRLIRDAVKEIKGETAEVSRECDIKIPCEMAIPEEYIETPAARLEVYRRFSNADEPEQVNRILENLKDQYGEPPDAVKILGFIAGIRISATRLSISKLDYQSGAVRAVFRETTPLKPEAVMELIVNKPDLYQFVPPHSLIITIGNLSGNDPVRKTHYALQKICSMV